MTSVLEALGKAPFEPLEQASLKNSTLKAVFLLAAASARRRGALHALSVKEGHLRFENHGIRLVPDPRFLTKTLSLDFLPDPIFLPKIDTFSKYSRGQSLVPGPRSAAVLEEGSTS